MRLLVAALIVLALAGGLLIDHFLLRPGSTFSEKEVRALTETAVTSTWRGPTSCFRARFRGHGLWIVTCTFQSTSGTETYYFTFNDRTGRVVDLATPP